MTGRTLAEKIIARAAQRDRVEPDEVVWVDVDVAMIHDSGGPRRMWPMLDAVGAGVRDPNRLVVVSDHYVPAKDVAAAQILETTRAFAAEFGIARFHEAEGIAHTLMVELGYLEPGMLYVGGDSHTCTGGVMGCLALGMGTTDLFGVVVTGRTWLRVPHTVRIEVSGTIPLGVSAKDLILTIIGDRGMAGGTYRVLEFGGEAIAEMPVEERSVLTNMSVELGAKTGIIPADSVTAAYLSARSIDVPVGPISDPDADYVDTWEYEAGALVPVVARPHRHDDVVPISEMTGARVTRAYIGACTGAKHEDLVMAARVLRGRRVADGVLLQVAPASRGALAAAVADGTAAALIEAGAHLLSTGCGACPGIGSGVLAAGEVCISTTSRNTRGRMGSPDSEVYLASPFSVAAAAVAGEIVDPTTLIGTTA